VAKKRAHGEGSLFQEKRGYWVAEITLPNGKRRRKYSKKQDVVKQWLLTQRNAIRSGVWVKDESLTVSQFIDRFYEDVASHTLRPKTLESYKSLIKNHIKPGIGSIKLSALRPDHLQKLYSDKLNSGLSRRTVQYIHSIIHRSLNQALRWGLVARNVSDLVDAPSVKRKPPQFLSPEEVKTFLGSVKDHRFYPIYVLAIATGMREGEVLGLHFEDVDFDKGIIHVRHAVQYLIGEGVVLTEPKTKKSRRSIKVPEFAMEVLEEHKENENRNQGLMFVTSNMTPFSPRNLVRHFKKALRDAGLPNIRFHDLRHTTASLLLSKGAHPKLVQELLGHSQISLTLDTYSHLIPAMHDELAEKMNDILV
jgi:integrase